MDVKDTQALQAFSQGELSALEVRRRLGGATYGEVLSLLSELDLPLPRAPVAGRGDQIRRARAWMFPDHITRSQTLRGRYAEADHLAAAQSLDYLRYLNADVVIPDAILHQATRNANRLGAQGIIDWVKVHRADVEIATTKAYEIFDAARAAIPNLREPDLGERAAVEGIEEPDRLQGDERGLLLCDETAVLRRVVVRDREHIVKISTLDFLRLLEAEQRIQSAEQSSTLPRKRVGRRLAPRS